jgi:hypothetical protein
LGSLQLLAQAVSKVFSSRFALCQANAPVVKKLIYLHDALAQLLDFTVVMGSEFLDLRLMPGSEFLDLRLMPGSEFLDLRLVPGFGLREMSAEFLDLRLVARFRLSEKLAVEIFDLRDPVWNKGAQTTH